MLRVIIFLALLFIGSSAAAQECPEGYICTESGTNSTVNTTGETTTNINSPPPSAIAPSLNTSNSDLCTIGVSGAVQTQILGISTGMVFTEENCLRLKNAKTLFDMGMKVAAVSVMCQDELVWQAMMDAGTPCPYDGMIGESARAAWNANPERVPGAGPDSELLDLELDDTEKKWLGAGGVVSLLMLLLL